VVDRHFEFEIGRNRMVMEKFDVMAVFCCLVGILRDAHVTCQPAIIRRWQSSDRGTQNSMKDESFTRAIIEAFSSKQPIEMMPY
jgi:hypothetical protein